MIALAGRRIDAADAETSRFPLSQVERVRQRVRELFTKYRPAALVCSPACGADLIALQVAAELGIRRRIVLPFAPRQFLQTSVADRPGDWADVYQEMIQSAQAERDLVIVGGDPVDDQIYLRTNEAILDEAVELSKASDGKVAVVLVWDGRPRGAGDVTAAFGTKAEERGFPVEIIRTDQNPAQRDMSGASSPN